MAHSATPRCNAMQRNPPQCNAMQRNATQATRSDWPGLTAFVRRVLLSSLIFYSLCFVFRKIFANLPPALLATMTFFAPLASIVSCAARNAHSRHSTRFSFPFYTCLRPAGAALRAQIVSQHPYTTPTSPVVVFLALTFNRTARIVF